MAMEPEEFWALVHEGHLEITSVESTMNYEDECLKAVITAVFVQPLERIIINGTFITKEEE